MPFIPHHFSSTKFYQLSLYLSFIFEILSLKEQQLFKRRKSINKKESVSPFSFLNCNLRSFLRAQD
ncbi:hypothetical protein BpHYR1_036359 [Brachionus plicatilis]|uniref:Uncharacterized protein n=1 Tax=Brachionus plicatilis TaxID=10195 RepID=A0A3M7PH03_BRAPC|nr:hypothetical protein BpHYR1_036359 [Brachionus plicatilis]